MRAPVQKTRPRRQTSRQLRRPPRPPRPAGDGTGAGPPSAPGRTARVRNRLIVAVAVVAAAIAGAGAPRVLAASGELTRLPEPGHPRRSRPRSPHPRPLPRRRARRGHRVHRGRAGAKSAAPSKQRSARVDRQVEELSAETPAPPPRCAQTVETPSHRRRAPNRAHRQGHRARGPPGVLRRHHRAARPRRANWPSRLPPRAGAGAYAPRRTRPAVQQASATRGLLARRAQRARRPPQTILDPVTGLPVHRRPAPRTPTPKQRDALTAAAQQARVRSDAALADFRETAPAAGRSSYDATVTGPEVNTAEKYLDRPHRPAHALRQRGRHQREEGSARRSPPAST